MDEGKRLPVIARWSVESAMDGNHLTAPLPAEGFLAEPRGVFVTLHTRAGQLRGCVGTLVPRLPSLLEETWAVARQAAFGDSRFPPLSRDELEQVRFEVSVLDPLEPVDSVAGLDPRYFGVVVRTEDGRRGALLPGIAGIADAAEQVQVARRKGGILPGEAVRLERFAVRKFAETDAD